MPGSLENFIGAPNWLNHRKIGRKTEKFGKKSKIWQFFPEFAQKPGYCWENSPEALGPFLVAPKNSGEPRDNLTLNPRAQKSVARVFTLNSI